MNKELMKCLNKINNWQAPTTLLVNMFTIKKRQGKFAHFTINKLNTLLCRGKFR